MRKKICDAVVTGVGVVFMFDVFVGEFVVQRHSPFFKSIVVFNLESANPEVLERARKKVEEAHRKMAAIEAVKRGE